MRPWVKVAIGGAALFAARRGGSLVRRERLARVMRTRARRWPMGDLLRDAVGTPLLGGNRVELVEDGEIFRTLEALMADARESIHLTNFMWQGRGDPSERIGRALIGRRPGVACRVVLDGFGSKNLDPRMKARLERSGVELRLHRPSRHLVRMNHRRVVVIDGRVGVTGGFGIYKSWLGHGEGPEGWRDTAVVVRGPVVDQLQRAFDESLQVVGGDPLPPAAYPPLAPEGAHPAAFVASAPNVAGSTAAERMVYALAALARRRLWIANSYFVPDAVFRRLLVRRVRDGVDVRVLAPGPWHDVPLVKRGQERTYAPLLRGGVRIWEYQASMMHAKTVLADDVFANGSTNMDGESLSRLWEASLVVDAPEIARQYADRFRRDLGRSREITLAGWAEHRRREPVHELARRAIAPIEGWL